MHDDATAYFQRGNAFEELYKLKEAVGDYSKAIEINSMFALAYLKRGSLYKSLDDYSSAFSDYDRIIDLDAGRQVSAAANFRRGVLYGSLREYGKALIGFRLAESLGIKAEDIRIARLRLGI